MSARIGTGATLPDVFFRGMWGGGNGREGRVQHPRNLKLIAIRCLLLSLLYMRRTSDLLDNSAAAAALG